MTPTPTPLRQGEILLALARSTLISNLIPGRPLPSLDLSADEVDWLALPAATFVTLTEDTTEQARLRGCIGTIEAHRSLREDVCRNARAAAFEDPRFPPMSSGELDHIRVEVSLLSPLEPLPAVREDELLRLLSPGVDGLVLEAGGHRGTFLPQVWDMFPHPGEFLARLKQKADLPADAWPRGLRLWRYGVEKWSEPEDGVRM